MKKTTLFTFIFVLLTLSLISLPVNAELEGYVFPEYVPGEISANIYAINPYAVPNDKYENGWHFKLLVNFPEYENNVSFWIDDWKNADGEILKTNGNTKIVYNETDYYISSKQDYSESDSLVVVDECLVDCPGIQTHFDLFVKLPKAFTGGVFSTTHGIQSLVGPEFICPAVENGDVGIFPECVITCNEGYILNEDKCVGKEVPVFELIGKKYVLINNELTFEINATDVDGDLLTYSSDNLPEGATLEGITFNWTPKENQTGTHKVNFNVTDGLSTVTTNVRIGVFTILECNEVVQEDDLFDLEGVLLEYKGSKNSGDDMQTIKFKNVNNSELLERTFNDDCTFDLKIEGSTYTFQDAGSGCESDDWNIRYQCTEKTLQLESSFK
ncbi:Ig-like domain-containing protein [Candidatus Woesearchaeota archaeon]|jgi:hypothetical protein|nr:Ig-like domain-containing protein [Candidatus Woesearchaeota archaeon]